MINYAKVEYDHCDAQNICIVNHIENFDLIKLIISV
jgi:hypothetical protein